LTISLEMTNIYDFSFGNQIHKYTDGEIGNYKSVGSKDSTMLPDINTDDFKCQLKNWLLVQVSLNMSLWTTGVQQTNEQNNIRNNPSFRLKHPGVPHISDGSDGVSCPLTENITLPVAQAMGRIAYFPLLHCAWNLVMYTLHHNDMCVTVVAGAAVMLQPFTQRLAMIIPFFGW